MYIEKIKMEDFGIFHHLEMRFDKDRVNLLQGSPGSGKTTILAVLYSMLQDKEILNYKSDEKEAYLEMSIYDNEKHILLKKRYREGISEVVSSSFLEMQKVVSIKRKDVYLFYGHHVTNRNKLDSTNIQHAIELLHRLEVEDTVSESAVLQDHSSFRLMSGGIQMYYTMLDFLYHIPQGSVVMIDDPFSILDSYHTERLLNVMKKLENIQFIITLDQDRNIIDDSNKMIVSVESASNVQFNTFDFNYHRVFQHDRKLMKDHVDQAIVVSDDRPIIKYELGKEVDEAENRNVEFKEIKGTHPCRSIIDNAEIYINAFLNSHVSEVGIIKWGISDGGIVTGVPLSKKDRDTIDKEISERIGQMKPYVSTDCVQIAFEEIVADNEIVDECYVVEITVESHDSDILFSTSKNEIYIKTDGGKRKLTTYEIQKELQIRLKHERK